MNQVFAIIHLFFIICLAILAPSRICSEERTVPSPLSQSDESSQEEEGLDTQQETDAQELSDPFAAHESQSVFDGSEDSQWSYAGYASDGQQSLALIVHRSKGEWRILHQGQRIRIDGTLWTVKSIHPRRIVLEDDFDNQKEMW